MTKHPRFLNSDQFFACPHCGQALGLDLNSLRCPNRHTFDIAKQGYVNLAPQVKQSANYHKSSFENRQAFLEAGYYDHLYEALEGKNSRAGLAVCLGHRLWRGLLFPQISRENGLGHSCF